MGIAAGQCRVNILAGVRLVRLRCKGFIQTAECLRRRYALAVFGDQHGVIGTSGHGGQNVSNAVTAAGAAGKAEGNICAQLGGHKNQFFLRQGSVKVAIQQPQHCGGIGTSSAKPGEYGNSFFNMGMYPIIVDARFTQVCLRSPPDQITVVRRQGRIGAGESDRFFVCIGADLNGDRVAQSDGLHTAVQFMIAVIAASCNVQE